MFAYLFNNLPTILVLLVVAVIVALVIVKMVRDRRRQKKEGGCICSCAGCSSAGMCGPKGQAKNS